MALKLRGRSSPACLFGLAEGVCLALEIICVGCMYFFYRGFWVEEEGKGFYLLSGCNVYAANPLADLCYIFVGIFVHCERPLLHSRAG